MSYHSRMTRPALNRVQYPTRNARARAVLLLCSVLSTWPRPLVDAIEAHLAGAIVRRVHSVEYVSSIEHREAVWYREVLLSFDSTELVIVVQQPRMYALVDNHDFGTHTLELRCGPGVAAFAFTFTSCVDPTKRDAPAGVPAQA